MTRVYDAAILGSGLAGAAMAAVLAGMGWDTVVIDRHTFPRHKVCGEFLSPESMKLLASLGLDRTVRSLGPCAMTRAKLTAACGAAIEFPLPGRALGISRYALDQAIQDAARERGAKVWNGQTVVSIGTSPAGYRIETTARGESSSLEARVAIAAWGRGGNVRFVPIGADAESADTKKRRLGSTAGQYRIGVKSHFTGMRMGPSVELYFFPGGYVGLAPIEGGRVNAAALIDRDAFHAAGKTVHGALAMAGRLNPAFGSRLANAAAVPGSEAAAAPVRVGAKPLPWDAVPHIGDAAAVIPPLCGDGMAMALRSVECCAAMVNGCLRGRLSVAQWRAEYTRILLKEFSGPIRWGNAMQALFGSPVLSPALFRLGALWPGMAELVMRATRLKG